MSKKKKKKKTHKRKHKRKRKEKKKKSNWMKLPTKSKEKRKRRKSKRQRPIVQTGRKKKEEEGRGLETTYRPDQTKKKGDSSHSVFSPFWRENIWWVWGDNTQAHQFFFPLLPPTKHRSKKFFFLFSL